MKDTPLTFALISMLISVIMTSCEEPIKPSESQSNQAQRSSSEVEKHLLETLEESGYTVFAQLIEMTGVADDLAAGEPFTCFAPRNEAFKMDVLEKLKDKKKAKNDELLDLVRYHFIQGNQPKEIILISRREKTLSGKFILYWISGGEILINNHSKLIEADIKTEGGVIHGVSKILRADVEGAIP